MSGTAKAHNHSLHWTVATMVLLIRTRRRRPRPVNDDPLFPLMATHTHKVVPPFDFTEAEGLSVPKRYGAQPGAGQELLAANGYQGFSDFPCIPAGASDAELAEFEKRLVGAAFPDEYRASSSK